MTVNGVDYAFTPHPPAAALADAGLAFACRYMSPLAVNDANGKNLLAAELAQLLGAGLSVVVVEESAADRMQSGYTAGAADAQHGDAVTKALGMPGAVVYFACDFDATPQDQTLINAYLGGAASVIGLARTGIYGGYWPLSRALGAGKAAYAWQTSAWSGGQWDRRAHIRQDGSVKVAGVAVDFDQAMTADYGQWPRPSVSPAPAPGGLKQAVVSADVRLSWNAVTDQGTYLLQAEWYKPGFGWVLQVNEQVTGARIARGLQAGRYRWRVAAGSDHAWSAWREFEV